MKQTSSRPIDDISRAYMVFVSSGIAGFIEYCLTDGQLSLEEAQKIGYEVTLATMMGGAKIISS